MLWVVPVHFQNIHPKIFGLVSASFTHTFCLIRRCIWNGMAKPLLHVACTWWAICDRRALFWYWNCSNCSWKRCPSTALNCYGRLYLKFLSKQKNVSLCGSESDFNLDQSIQSSKIIQNSEYPMVLALQLTLMARVLIINQNVFFQVIQDLQSPLAFEQLLDVWISKMSSVLHSEKRKLLGKCAGHISHESKSNLNIPVNSCSRFGPG